MPPTSSSSVVPTKRVGAPSRARDYMTSPEEVQGTHSKASASVAPIAWGGAVPSKCPVSSESKDLADDAQAVRHQSSSRGSSRGPSKRRSTTRRSSMFRHLQESESSFDELKLMTAGVCATRIFGCCLHGIRGKHPMALHAPEVLECIKFVRLDFMQYKVKAPIPRNQELPPEAFGVLKQDTVLVTTSQGWFYEHHPDPEGKKLELMKNTFAPTLRRMYASAENILIFDDWMCCPQEPRTEQENRIFNRAMAVMNRVYAYADMGLHLHAPLPDLGKEIPMRNCKLDVGQLEMAHHRGMVQIRGCTSRSVEVPRASWPSAGDVLVNIDGLQVSSLEQVRAHDGREVELHFLRQPWGFPNKCPVDKRGWVYLERFISMLKVAMLEESEEDEHKIFLSNSNDVQGQILRGGTILREAAANGALTSVLKQFEDELAAKFFSGGPSKDATGALVGDAIVVCGLMSDLVQLFGERWDQEKQKHMTMVKRAKALVLQWGHFSDRYMDEAGFNRRVSTPREARVTCAKLMAMTALPALVAPLFFVLPLPGPRPDVAESTRFFASVCFFYLCGSTMGLLTASIQKTFAQIPWGLHTCISCLGLSPAIMVVICSGISCLVGAHPVPLIMPVMGIPLWILISEVVTETEFIPVRGQEGRWNLDTWFAFPPHLRYQKKARDAVEAVDPAIYLTLTFMLIYPLLASIFLRLGALAQGICVVVFLGLRVAFETAATIVARQFGMDVMPVVLFFGICVHEICLSMMLSNVRHPIVVAMLIGVDVAENTLCLWGIVRAQHAYNAQQRAYVAPMLVKQDMRVLISEAKQGAAGDLSAKERLRLKHETKVRKHTKNMFLEQLVNAFMDQPDVRKANGMLFYITVVLLSREVVEFILPIQGITIISLLYHFNPEPNALVHKMTHGEYETAIFYLCIDALVEGLVFVLTIIVLHFVCRETSVWRVMRGIMIKHFVPMLVLGIVAWIYVLMMQFVYSGMDLDFEFRWMVCNDNVWNGGLEWHSCDANSTLAPSALANQTNPD